MKSQRLHSSPGASGNFEHITPPHQTYIQVLNEAISFWFNILQLCHMLVLILRLGSRHNQGTHLCVPRYKLKVSRRPRALSRQRGTMVTAGTSWAVLQPVWHVWGWEKLQHSTSLSPHTQVQQPKAQSLEPVDRCVVDVDRSPGVLEVPTISRISLWVQPVMGRKTLETGCSRLQQMLLPKDPVRAALDECQCVPGHGISRSCGPMNVKGCMWIE